MVQKLYLLGCVRLKSMGKNYQQKFDLIYKELAEEHECNLLCHSYSRVLHLEKDYLAEAMTNTRHALGVNPGYGQ